MVTIGVLRHPHLVIFSGKIVFLAIGSPVHPSPGMPSNAGDMGRKGTAALILYPFSARLRDCRWGKTRSAKNLATWGCSLNSLIKRPKIGVPSLLGTNLSVGNMFAAKAFEKWEKVETLFTKLHRWKGINLNAKTKVRLLFVAPTLLVSKFTFFFKIFDSLQVCIKITVRTSSAHRNDTYHWACPL
jgi:hypothetical protein